jgi:hypothetical protein
MQSDSLRQQIGDFLRFRIPETPVPFTAHDLVEEQSYTLTRISYTGEEDDPIQALLWLPDRTGPCAAILIHHQHNSERHLGKSEVAGLVGDPLQAFGPAWPGVALRCWPPTRSVSRIGGATAAAPSRMAWPMSTNITTRCVIAWCGATR